MNERIQELAKQAEDHADNQGFFVTIDFASDYQDCLMEKFAELIVRECADVTHRLIVEDGKEFPVKSVAYRLKEHFGVE